VAEGTRLNLNDLVMQPGIGARWTDSSRYYGSRYYSSCYYSSEFVEQVAAPQHDTEQTSGTGNEMAPAPVPSNRDLW
jgi:hypothetical protein